MRGDRLERLASRKIALVFVLLLCLSLRVGMAFYKGDIEITDNDARVYLRIADNLLMGRGFSMGKHSYDLRLTAYSEPAYPFFLAGLSRTVGDGLLDISLAQSVLDTITCLLVCQLAFVASGGRRLWALLAGLAYAVYPPFILSTCTPMTETLAILVGVACFRLTLTSARGGLSAVTMAGVLAGALALVKASMLALPIALAVTFLLKREDTGSRVMRSAVYVAAAFAVVVPWTVRNYVVLDALIPITTRGGMVLWGGTGPADGVTLGAWHYPVDSKERNLYDHPRIPDVEEKTYVKITSFQQRIGAMSEVERDKALKRAALSEIREHPGRFVFLAAKKVFRLWFNLWHDWPASAGSKAVAGLNVFCIMLAVAALLKKIGTSEFRALVLISCGYVTVISIITNAVVRYSYPVLPLVLILAAGYVGSLVGSKRSSPDGLPKAFWQPPGVRS